MNVRLLRKIARHILAEPRRYDQDIIIWKGKPGERAGFSENKYPPCGTMACIGGWALVLSGYPNSSKLDKAAQLLKINDEQADRLFSGSAGVWPDKFDEGYRKAKTPAGRARWGARRIEHFIKTNGME